MESQLLNLLGVEDYHRVTIHYFILFCSQVSFAVTPIFIYKVIEAQRGCRWTRGSQPVCDRIENVIMEGKALNQ